MGFFGDHRWLSNFAVEHDGVTVEHYYQAAKARSKADRQRILDLPTAKEAKREGALVELRGDWEKIKVSVMEEQVRRKFSHDPFRWMLIATGERELVEENHWGDTFWGVSDTTGRGKNHLGRILMQVREEARIAELLIPGTRVQWQSYAVTREGVVDFVNKLTNNALVFARNDDGSLRDLSVSVEVEKLTILEDGD